MYATKRTFFPRSFRHKTFDLGRHNSWAAPRYERCAVTSPADGAPQPAKPGADAIDSRPGGFSQIM